MLDDGLWHSLEEIKASMQLDENRLSQVIDFLKRYNFLVEDETGEKIRLEDAVRRFLDETATS